MNGQTAKLLRKIAKTIGKDPKYIKKYYKAMPVEQQSIYRNHVLQSMEKLEKRKEALNGANMSTLSKTNNSESKRE